MIYIPDIDAWEDWDIDINELITQTNDEYEKLIIDYASHSLKLKEIKYENS